MKRAGETAAVLLGLAGLLIIAVPCVAVLLAAAAARDLYDRLRGEH